MVRKIIVIALTTFFLENIFFWIELFTAKYLYDGLILHLAGFSVPVILAGALTINRGNNQHSLKNLAIVISLASLLIILIHMKFSMLEFIDWRFCFINKLGAAVKTNIRAKKYFGLMEFLIIRVLFYCLFLSFGTFISMPLRKFFRKGRKSSKLMVI